LRRLSDDLAGRNPATAMGVLDEIAQLEKE
jgi:hypothetical protein